MSAHLIQKPISDLTIQDLKLHPVWRFLPETDIRDATWVTPVLRLPVSDLQGCIVAAPVHMASGRQFMAYLGNVSLQNAESTEHFLTASLIRADGACFHLARYHDVDYALRRPDAAAGFLGVAVEEVFPLTCDLSRVVQGLPEVVRGAILREPRRRLSQDELIALSLE